MRGFRILAFAGVMTATAFLGACASGGAMGSGGGQTQESVRDWNSVAITLTRGVCFGACPDYTVTIHGDGRVEYEGRRFVAETGKHEARISDDAVHSLFAQFMAAKFFSLHDEYRAQATDLPTYMVMLTYDGRSKTVLDYGGHMVGMPEAVTELENAIDQFALTQRWVKGRGTR